MKFENNVRYDNYLFWVEGNHHTCPLVASRSNSRRRQDHVTSDSNNTSEVSQILQNESNKAHKRQESSLMY